MPETKTFSLGAILTVTTGRLVCPLGEVYALVRHMTGANVHSHQLSRVMKECAPWLLRWFPACATVAIETLDTLIFVHGPEAGCQAYLKALLADPHMELTETYLVDRGPSTSHAVRDPVDELMAMTGADRVIVARVPQEGTDHAV